MSYIISFCELLFQGLLKKNYIYIFDVSDLWKAPFASQANQKSFKGFSNTTLIYIYKYIYNKPHLI